MEEFYEKCTYIEQEYLKNYTSLMNQFRNLELDAVGDPAQLELIKEKRTKYIENLYSKEDLDNLVAEKQKIIEEYKELENIDESDDDMVSKTQSVQNIISNSDIQPKPIATTLAESAESKTIIEPTEDKKISDNNKKDMNVGKVVKDTEAENLSKMLDNFKYGSSPQTQQQPMTMPTINVSPVQVVQIDQDKLMKKNVNKLVKKALNKYITEKKIKKKKKSPVVKPAVNVPSPVVKPPVDVPSPVVKPPVDVPSPVVKPPVDVPSPVVKPKKTKKKRDLRSFTIFTISKNLECKQLINEGRYRSSNPQDAARKAFNRYCNKSNQTEKTCAYFLTVKETTRGSDGDLNTYKMVRTKLKNPIVMFPGTPREYFIKYGTDVEAVQTPKNCIRNKIGSESKSLNKSKKNK